MKTRIPATVLLVVTLIAYGREQKDEPAVEFKRVSLDETMAQLRLYPSYSYLQYVAMILARNENRSDEIAGEIERMIGRENRWEEARNRRQQVDLFSIFTGALAVQESLQLDTMRGGGRGRMPAEMMKGKPAPSKSTPKGGPVNKGKMKILEKMRPDQVSVVSLPGPTIKSHPWEQMLAGKKPAISSLARCVPENFYLVEFRSIAKMLEAMETSD